MLDINSIVRRVLIKFPTFGIHVANLNFKPKSDIKTACTNGKVVYYNPNFLAKLSDKQKEFVVAHEICHVALDHMKRSSGKNPLLWNLATDAVINANLKAEGLPLTEGAVEVPGAEEFSAEEVYTILEKQNDRQSNDKQNGDMSNSKSNGDANSQSSGNSGQENAEESGFDVDIDELAKSIQNHDMWSESVDRENSSKDEGEQSKSEDSSDHDNDCKCKNEKDFFEKAKEEREKNLDEMRKQIIKESTGSVGDAGQNRGGSQIEVDYEANKKGVLNWKKLLGSFLKGGTYDWKLGRQVKYGVIPYVLSQQPKPVTEILLDTSGSVSHTLLKNFMRECRSLLKESAIKVGCFDTEFYGFHEIRNEKDIKNFVLEGGGGTDFDVAVNAFSATADNRIIFTDGCADTPKKNCKAVWVIFNYTPWSYYANNFNPPGGKVIKLSQKEYENLSLVQER